MLIDYARVSTHDQNAAMQEDALRAAGCERIFVETISGASHGRPKLKAALRAAKDGDAIVVWKLDRLARSFPHLLETVASSPSFVALSSTIQTRQRMTSVAARVSYIMRKPPMRGCTQTDNTHVSCRVKIVSFRDEFNWL